ncbi:DNA-binding transcriptional LysR family regulator [Devosia subaequoris]|uniref:DNA-binding transcriptional LysR family regulator n=1 Tax=Devosia subaequoris TaxID=395930 RepID=A0A7W6IQG3_9HYPH|nr:LysR family transcriptional regulator [Devosia subaequoris]MBB4053407.1 DNA-binding transcriptional LysR family regulator [Devosia subaequoris]MCP1210784.1 LysR family transcriptional regulator [Devosia subaequoris]
MNSTPDWSLWRSFAAVIAEGSLSAAARQLGLSQPTLGRHIEALEAALGLSLFERSLTGLKPNATALKLYGSVDRARSALAEASILAAGAQDEAGGTVRLTASTMISNYVLPEILAGIRRTHPRIAIESVPTDSAENLLMREADIAVRMFRPTQLELVTRHLGDIPLVPVAHESYLARRGTPTTLNQLWDHDLLGYDRADAVIRHARSLGFEVTRDHFPVRSDDQPHLWELLRAGLGTGFAQLNLARRTPGLVVLPLDLAIPPLPIWLTTHRELFTSHRIRAIYDAVAEGLTAYIKSDPISPPLR